MVNIREIRDISDTCHDGLSKKLLSLATRKGYDIIQTNGQRVFAPPGSRNVPAPPKGCEVFIGKLHRSIYEDELVPLFETVGPLYMFRLMLDFRNQTRGYAFATYFRKEHADKAVKKLDGYEIRRGLHIGVFKSVDNCRLFVGNLLPQVNKWDLKELLGRYVNGLVDIIMYPDYERPHLNRGFAFAEFETHRLAAMARRQFAPCNLEAWGRALYVDWADPLPEVDPKIMAKVSVLYLKNIPMDYTSEEVATIVRDVVGGQCVQKVHKIQNYAFAHFVNRRYAEYAFRKLQGLVVLAGVCGQPIQVEWARPKRFSKKLRLTQPPNNFCTSVPPNMRRLAIMNKNSTRNDSLYNSFASGVPNSSSFLHV